MIVDTSALVAVILKENDYRHFLEKMIDSQGSRLSAVNYMEASMVLLSRRGDVVIEELDQLLLETDIQVVPGNIDQARLAIAAFRQYGKGRHPAGLNFGDCFSYALAKSCAEPLLFKGNDFTRTDVSVA